MDKDLIEILTKEHNEIRDIFDALDVAQDLESKKLLIKKLQSVIGPHLKKEDEEVYPLLEKCQDEEVCRMARIFALTMKSYAEDLAVVEECILTSVGELPQCYVGDYEKIRDKIKDRMTIEEVTIFPAYKKIL